MRSCLVPENTRPGDVLAERYRLTDLLTESKGGRFWRAFDSVLQRDVAVHIIGCEDERAPLLREAARRSATVLDRRMLRVLDIDIDQSADRCFVVNEWGSGTSLDILLADAGPLSPTVSAWIIAEVADTLALAHEAHVAHGRLVPENVLIDTDGSVRLIGFAVDAALHGLPDGRVATDVADLVGLLYAAMTGKWAGVSRSAVPSRAVDRTVTCCAPARCEPASPATSTPCASTSSTTAATPRSPPRPWRTLCATSSVRRPRRPRPGWPGSSTLSAARASSSCRRCPTLPSVRHCSPRRSRARPTPPRASRSACRTGRRTLRSNSPRRTAARPRPACRSSTRTPTT